MNMTKVTQEPEFKTEAPAGSLWSSTLKFSYSCWYDPSFLLAEHREGPGSDVIRRYTCTVMPSLIIMYLGQSDLFAYSKFGPKHRWHRFLLGEKIAWANQHVCGSLIRVG